MTSHRAFEIYNLLFTHLEKSIAQVRRKRIPWKKEMLTALKEASNKLQEYYGKTKSGLDSFYGKATLLDPSRGDTLFSTPEWESEPDEASWASIYWRSLEKEFDEYMASGPHPDQVNTASTKRARHSSDPLSDLLDQHSDDEDQLFVGNENELDKYRRSGILVIILTII